MVKSSEYRGVTLFRPTGKWRAQISANGKTTSLGDHETEMDAAKAFDRACINKSGALARTNFPLEDYASELEDLQSMPQGELVALLRSRARKSGTQTSHYRGVSLLKQTGKWHAQINVGGKQVHLGFFATEQLAARAYDRAAINKGARDGGKIITNFDILNYHDELDYLRRIPQDQLVDKLSKEDTRKGAMDLLANGFNETCIELFPIVKDDSWAEGLPSVETLVNKAERAAPKPTAKDPLYPNFGKHLKKEMPRTPEKLDHRAMSAAVVDGAVTRGYPGPEPRKDPTARLASPAIEQSTPPRPYRPPYAGQLATPGRSVGVPMVGPPVVLTPLPPPQLLFANAFTEFTPRAGAVQNSAQGDVSSPQNSQDQSREPRGDGRMDGRGSVQGARRSVKRRLVEPLGTPSPHSSSDGPYSLSGAGAAHDEVMAVNELTYLASAASGALEAASGAGLQKGVLSTPPRPTRAAQLSLATPAKQDTISARKRVEDNGVLEQLPQPGQHVGPRSARRPRALPLPATSDNKDGQLDLGGDDDDNALTRLLGLHIFQSGESQVQPKAAQAPPVNSKRYSPWRRKYVEHVEEEVAEVEGEVGDSQGVAKEVSEERLPSRRRKAAPARAAVA